ncbi:MAG: MFS transporter [Proteobacteria bacterium]|nr:MFS transporter [Pseudomonadota bacterium]
MKTQRLGRDFMRLWLAQSISAVGSEISAVAIPLFAVTTLGFGAHELGFVLAMEGIPPVLFGLFAGVWVDRLSRRTILLASDILRFLLVLSMPLLYWAGWFTTPVLFVCTFLIASITVFFDIAYWSYLPSIVAKDELAHGNSRLSMTQSIATTGGPSLAGAITSFIGPPAALVLDALSYLASFLFLTGTRRPQPAASDEPAPPVLAALREGLAFVLGNRFLIMLALGAATWHLIYFSTLTNFYLYLARDLAAPPYVVGLLLSCGGLGALAGAPLVPKLRDTIGSVPLLCATLVVAQTALLAIPFVREHALLPEVMLGSALFFGGAASTAHSVVHVTLRQETTPQALLGRMTSIVRLVTWGAIPAGSLAGGLLAQSMSSRDAFHIISLVGYGLTAAWVLAIVTVPGFGRALPPLAGHNGQPG